MVACKPDMYRLHTHLEIASVMLPMLTESYTIENVAAGALHQQQGCAALCKSRTVNQLRSWSPKLKSCLLLPTIVTGAPLETFSHTTPETLWHDSATQTVQGHF